MNRVAEIAEPAAQTGPQLAALDDASVQIALASGRPAHRVPEGKFLARVQHQPVELFGGQIDVHRLVLLQNRIDARPALDETGIIGIDAVRQGRSALVGRKTLFAARAGGAHGGEKLRLRPEQRGLFRGTRWHSSSEPASPPRLGLFCCCSHKL